MPFEAETKPRQTVLILCFTRLERDPRVLRQIASLANDFDIVTAGLSHPGVTVKAHFDLAKRRLSPIRKIEKAGRLLARDYEAVYWGLPVVQDALAKLSSLRPDVIIANDVETLPLAVRLSQDVVPVFLDAHEFAPKHHDDSLIWRLFFKGFNDHICRVYIPKLKAACTVSLSIAKEYEKLYGMTFDVVTNAPHFNARLGLRPTGTVVKMVHHGGAIRKRRLEGMIETMKHLGKGYELTFFLVPDPRDGSYLQELKDKASSLSTICFCDPVPTTALAATLNQFDLGVYLLQPISFNCEFALPNKIFEYIQGRLAIAVGPSPEMAKLVKTYECGVVSDRYDAPSLAEAIKSLKPSDIDRLKANSHKHAYALSAEGDSLVKYRELVQRCLK